MFSKIGEVMGDEGYNESNWYDSTGTAENSTHLEDEAEALGIPDLDYLEIVSYLASLLSLMSCNPYNAALGLDETMVALHEPTSLGIDRKLSTACV